jgi:AAA+ ATPase superfamily predicted ATPase
MKENPFPITSYKGPVYFCNRQNEIAQLKEALLNGRNITLFSPRRMGKTGLIHHLFHGLRDAEINTVYADVFGTDDLNGFINRLANSVLSAISDRGENIITRALEIFGRLRPQVSYNGLSGAPLVSFTLQNDAEKRSTLSELFEILEKQKAFNIMAIDEFQQIYRYPEKNAEQLLRSYIQELKNTCIIFSGSQRHLLLPMFSDPKRAFYQSSSFLQLNRLDYHEYREFIQHQFERNEQTISAKNLDFILDWTETYTFYTQYLCNKIFSKRQTRITGDLIRLCINEIFTEREPIFYNYRNLLAHQQYRLLSAVAREVRVDEPTGQEFLKKYDLSNASTVRKNLHVLIEKEMIYEIPGGDKTTYQVYDVFLAQWFRMRENRATFQQQGKD